MSDDDQDNVIQFSLAHRTPGSSLGHRPWTATRKCTHQSVLVEEPTREVTCAQCGVVLDAFTVLLQYANRERRFEWSSQDVQREHKARRAQCEQLRAEEKRLKARVRAAKKRDPEEHETLRQTRQEHHRERTVANANEAIELLQKIVRANGGKTAEQRQWAAEVRRNKAGPTRIFGGSE